MDSVSSGMTATSVSSKAPANARNTPTAPVSFAIIGGGWRSTVFIRMAYLFPERFRLVGVVTRREEPGLELERLWGVPTFRSLDDLLAVERPDFVIPLVPWDAAPGFIRMLVDQGIPVLCETPPAADLDGLRELWTDVGATGLVQIAEQYPFMPLHAAHIALAHSGLIGTPTNVHFSSTHLYHAVAVMRKVLGVGVEPVTVFSQVSTAPLVNPITPAGWTRDSTEHQARSILSTLDFGGGRSGVYDFTDNQWWNPLRPDHLQIRGSAGEIHDGSLVRMLDPVTPVVSRIDRVQSGSGMNYEGLDLQHIVVEGQVVFRNRFEGGRLSDDDIGVAELLDRMGAWIRDEAEPPYPLAWAMHDHHVGIAIERSVESGQPVTTSVEAWA